MRLEAARTLSLNRLQRWRSVVLPSVAPGILLNAAGAWGLLFVVGVLGYLISLAVDVLSIK